MQLSFGTPPIHHTFMLYSPQIDYSLDATSTSHHGEHNTATTLPPPTIQNFTSMEPEIDISQTTSIRAIRTNPAHPPAIHSSLVATNLVSAL